MARKPQPKIEPKDLYEEKIVYVVAYVDSTAFGKFISTGGQRVPAVGLAMQFPEYDDAHKYIVDNMLEGVTIYKVWL